MPLVTDERQLERKSRIAGLRLVLLTLRLMENWKHDVDDYDRAMILVAVAAITAERLLRAESASSHAAMSDPLPAGMIARCNVSSIASATGLNRETTRRKVGSLIALNLLMRLDNGAITFAPGVIQDGSTHALVRRQLEDLARTCNDLMRDGILELASSSS